MTVQESKHDNKQYYFEDFSVGQTFQSGERKIRSEDIAEFAELTGDRNKLHVDQEYAEKSIFNGRIAHGMLSLSISMGLWHSQGITNETVIAFVELSRAEFLAPVYPGTSLSLVSEVVSKRESKSRGNAGLVTWFDRLLDTRSEKPVLEFERTFMVKKRN